jgi:methionyl-tRNA formyltransferase
VSTTNPLVIALSAEESAGVQILRSIAAGPHRVALVLTSRPGAEVRGATVWHLARTLGLETLPARRVRRPELARRLEEEGVDLLLNVHSLHVIHDAVVRVPRIGAFNLHPGPLPRYAGLNAPSHALRLGETSYGVTLHWMDAGIDTGAIAWQTTFEIGDGETGLTLSIRCIREGVALLTRLLETAGRDASSIPRVEQSVSERTYFGRGIPDDGRLAWDRPARSVFDFIRAADFHPLPSPWGTLRARFGDAVIGIVRAGPPRGPADAAPGTIATGPDGVTLVACRDAWLPLVLVRHEGAVRDAADVLRDGMRLTGG